MTQKTVRTALSVLIVLANVSACMTYGASPASDPAPSVSSSSHASSVMHDASGRELGTLTVSETGSGLLTTGTLRGLATGVHGIHLHAVGRCEAPFTTAGAHWNPAGRQHGTNNPAGPHMGDMQNIVVSSDGSADVRVTTPGGTLHGMNGLIDADGAAIVVHANADDYRTDPIGNSGARVACGVVRD
jgi:Cu-Zn family superoxide dismutase